MTDAPLFESFAKREQLRAWACAAIIVSAALAAYHNSFSGALVFDDLPAIRDNPTIRTLWPLTTPLSPPVSSGVGGRPLANLSLVFNYAFGGTSVSGYHAVNLLLHIGSALLLFGIVRRTLWCSARANACALAVALLWVAHPLATAAVSYLSQRTELLMGFCYLLTLYTFLRGTENGAHARRWLGLSVAACACGMMSKEVMVTAPVVVFLHDRTFIAGSLDDAWRRRGHYYLALAATWLVLAFLLTTGLSQRSVGFGLGVTPAQYLLTACEAIVRYLWLALIPAPLVFDYGPVYATNIAGSFAAGFLLATLLGGSAWLLRHRSALGFAGVSFFVLLAPTSSIVPVTHQPIAENRMYLPLIAVIVIVVVGVQTVVRSRATFLAVVGAAISFAAITVARNANYRTELALWTDTVAKRPENPRAHFNVGVVLLDSGRPAAAIPHFEHALQRAPLHAEAHNSLGNAWLALGRLDDASAHYAKAIALRPDYARAWHNRGAALFRAGNITDAIACFERALQLAPDFAATHQALGNAYFRLNQPARAVAEYERALGLDPGLADAHYSAGSACFDLGRFPDAVAHFAAAARLRPRDVEIRNFHGAALLRAGRPAEAIAEFEYALRVQPDFADARENLAAAQAEFARVR
jgi:tetratricopeptide (TPR) repeat protein